MLNCGEGKWEFSLGGGTGIRMMKMGLELVKGQLILEALKIDNQITQNILGFAFISQSKYIFNWDSSIMENIEK